MIDRFYTITQAAAIMGITIAEVEDYLPIQKIGSYLRITEVDIIRYVKDNNIKVP